MGSNLSEAAPKQLGSDNCAVVAYQGLEARSLSLNPCRAIPARRILRKLTNIPDEGITTREEGAI